MRLAEKHLESCNLGKQTTYGGTGEWPDYSPPMTFTGANCTCWPERMEILWAALAEGAAPSNEEAIRDVLGMFAGLWGWSQVDLQEITGQILAASRAPEVAPPPDSKLKPMVEAYRLWATGRMSASDFGRIADQAVIAYDQVSGLGEPTP